MIFVIIFNKYHEHKLIKKLFFQEKFMINHQKIMLNLKLMFLKIKLPIIKYQVLAFLLITIYFNLVINFFF